MVLESLIDSLIKASRGLEKNPNSLFYQGQVEVFKSAIMQVKNCSTSDVNNSRELLISFLQFGREFHYTHATIIDMVDDYEANS